MLQPRDLDEQRPDWSPSGPATGRRTAGVAFLILIALAALMLLLMLTAGDGTADPAVPTTLTTVPAESG
jgi:hypothetical protein